MKKKQITEVSRNKYGLDLLPYQLS